ncbi:hypothetical protein Psch_01770 [Pelotomaculum schinkii]|uniref:O-Antigen ligase n=1 Tax=Pelotomaculum schinkii TaxID=78350 RepID=A0A4Y7RGS4_9FIRM|nr:hypothetical protein [Pelotomaculum schinkii]TEB08215.1 hypothetical protein Psch_01770 [Pelotomaculum schinkii]
MTIGVYTKNNYSIKCRTTEKINRHTKTQYALFGLIVACCLGEVINIYGIKLSWIMALLTIVFFIGEHNSLKIKIPTYDIKLFFYFFIIWGVYATVQTAFILKNDYAVSNYISLLVNLFTITMLTLNIQSKKDIIFLNKGLVLGLIINLLIAYWELFTGNHLVLLNERNMLYYSDKALGVFGNGNDLATFICFGIIAVLLQYAFTNKNKVPALIIITASMYIIIRIGARGALYGMIVYGLCFAFFCILIKLYSISKASFSIVLYLLCVVCVIIGFIVLSNYTLIDLVLMISSPGNESSDLFRLSLMGEALQLFFNSFFLGIGPGQSIVLLGTNVHNFFLEIMCEYGIIIISGILMIFIYLLRAYRWKLPKLLTLCILSFTPAFVLIGVSSSGANRIRTTWILITIMYLAISLYKKESANVLK